MSAQVVKLGEKQIENIIEKMDAFKSENFKFKTSMKQKFYDGEKRFNENKVVVETELHRLKRKVETQIEEQQTEFNKTISECKVSLVFRLIPLGYNRAGCERGHRGGNFNGQEASRGVHSFD